MILKQSSCSFSTVCGDWAIVVHSRLHSLERLTEKTITSAMQRDCRMRAIREV